MGKSEKLSASCTFPIRRFSPLSILKDLLSGINITFTTHYVHKPRQHILKSRDITLPTKVNLVKALLFPIVMYGCESCTVKKAEHQRIDGFELWCWRRFLKVPWTARRSNQSILKDIIPEYSWEGLILKLQYFGHLIQRAN